ncbi:phosphomannomutase/phosphoglucomutase [Solimonas soli]|uniref:phosphomannomutase/phosphoglucomutase n=1 Tax=Solimonas soli TaxID=413479 RepID=UPI0004B1C3DA|nr:phosphomannomutase/phosphoglucomutase [Solimonas soli]
MPLPLSCFKAYDIRGRVPDELNEDIAYRLGLAFAQRFQSRRVALGRDIRHSSASLLNALAHGLAARGVEVLDLGLCGTEEVYWAAQQAGIDGAIEVTASHNPIDYNGMKLVLGGAIPVSGDSGLHDLRELTAASTATAPQGPAPMRAASFREGLVQFLCRHTPAPGGKRLKIVVNPGNGAAGPLVEALAPHLPFELIRIHFEPDGSFPNGIPNPLLPENRGATAEAVRRHGADFGVAWDGDFDRCFLFDENGGFIEGYYIVGLLAEALLREHPGQKIVHDPRLTWNTVDVVGKAGGVAVQSKTGHAFIKERMRREDAVYGGEMSAHHYFRDFAYCDSGMLPWILVAKLVAETGKPLSALVGERMRLYPASGEINRVVPDVKTVIAAIRGQYESGGTVDTTDGLSIEFPDWRFNLRGSNTEPVLRLNVESRHDVGLMKRRTEELLQAIDRLGGAAQGMAHA